VQTTRFQRHEKAGVCVSRHFICSCLALSAATHQHQHQPTSLCICKRLHIIIVRCAGDGDGAANHELESTRQPCHLGGTSSPLQSSPVQSSPVQPDARSLNLTHSFTVDVPLFTQCKGPMLEGFHAIHTIMNLRATRTKDL
jgi:hypothetical protein